MAPPDIEIALEWASRALEAFEDGCEGQYGPYTVEIGKYRVLRRGPIIDLSWPAGRRVKITGPSVDGYGGHTGRLGWAWINQGEGALRVVPDGCGWRQRAGIYLPVSIEEVA